jgi:hypothetical protein
LVDIREQTAAADGQVDIKQKIEDHKRVLKEDTKKLEYYRKKHEGLELEYIE